MHMNYHRCISILENKSRTNKIYKSPIWPNNCIVCALINRRMDKIFPYRITNSDVYTNLNIKCMAIIRCYYECNEIKIVLNINN